jgi:hypothetical protein
MNEAIYTRCCIAGGGPAGVMSGFLLARTMRAEVTDLIEEKGAVAGVQVKTPEGPLQIRAQLTIGLTDAIL